MAPERYIEKENEMAGSASDRRLWGRLTRYFDSSPFDSVQVVGTGVKSHGLELYDRLAKARFTELPESVTEREFVWLETFHRERLAAEREERRMHFGALALVSVLFFLLLPTVVTQTTPMLPIDIVALLLFVLFVPYVFVYFGYENRVRAMTLGLLRLMEARALRAERGSGS
jgi:hypothetical protein